MDAHPSLVRGLSLHDSKKHRIPHTFIIETREKKKGCDVNIN